MVLNRISVAHINQKCVIGPPSSISKIIEETPDPTNKIVVAMMEILPIIGLLYLKMIFDKLPFSSILSLKAKPSKDGFCWVVFAYSTFVKILSNPIESCQICLV